MNSSTESDRASKILIVDDDKVISFLHNKKLELFNFIWPPENCINGKEALDFIKKEDPFNTDFLIFLDLNMPVMNGWEFLDQIQKEPFLHNLNVVVVSTTTHKPDLIKALAYKQVLGFCQKPLTSERLKEITELKEVQNFIKTVIASPEM